MGPIEIESLNGKMYIFICVDDFYRYTWVEFLKEKSDTFEAFKILCLKLKFEKDCNIGKIVHIRSDHVKEFENSIYDDFY